MTFMTVEQLQATISEQAQQIENLKIAARSDYDEGYNDARSDHEDVIARLTAENERLQDQLNQPPMWGENHCGAKLTDADVLAIRARYKRYDRLHGTPAIAREYGMSHSAIGAVVRGLAWKHLPLTALQPKEGDQ